MDTKIYQKLSYGLFVLSVNVEKRDNACIINTGIQVSSSPDRICFAVNKTDFTCEMLDYTDKLCLSAVSEDAGFPLFERFGFKSGRDVEKFDGFDYAERTSNGTLAVTKGTNSYICATVEQKIDLGSHYLYIAAVTDGKILSSVPSATYAFYHANIKPKPQKSQSASSGKTVWRCAVCGYEYEGDELPADFVCPLCKHGASDFEKVTK